MNKDYSSSYYRILNILYPEFSNLSDRRKEAIEHRSQEITMYASQIDALFDQMKNPKSPLYQKGASDKDIVNIAAIYSKIYTESNKQISSPTGKMLRGGNYGDAPEEEYKPDSITEQEILFTIKQAVEKYKSTPKITLQNILKRTKMHIDYNTALKCSEVLNKINNQTEVHGNTTDNKEMEI